MEMNRIPCQYAIVRFMPFIETGEFANIGVIMMAPKARYYGFKLLRARRHARITRFFEDIDPKLFRATVLNLKIELQRIQGVLKTHGFDKCHKDVDIQFAANLFNEIVRPRESLIRFSEPRVVLASEPAAKLNDLFQYYIERNFITKEYREAILENRVRTLLKAARVGGNFSKTTIGDNEYKVTFPFVKHAGQIPTKIIKPLNLGQDDPSQIIEHGGRWQFRVRELQRRNLLPNRVLFAVEGPNCDDGREHAFREAQEFLRDTGVTVLPFLDQNQILDFAMAD